MLHAFYNKGHRERCSEQVPKWDEIAAAAAGEALQHERCVSILIERITSGEHDGPAKVFNAAQPAFRSLLVSKSSMPALPVHRRIDCACSVGGLVSLLTSVLVQERMARRSGAISAMVVDRPVSASRGTYMVV